MRTEDTQKFEQNESVARDTIICNSKNANYSHSECINGINNLHAINNYQICWVPREKNYVNCHRSAGKCRALDQGANMTCLYALAPRLDGLCNVFPQVYFFVRHWLFQMACGDVQHTQTLRNSVKECPCPYVWLRGFFPGYFRSLNIPSIQLSRLKNSFSWVLQQYIMLSLLTFYRDSSTNCLTRFYFPVAPVTVL